MVDQQISVENKQRQLSNQLRDLESQRRNARLFLGLWLSVHFIALGFAIIYGMRANKLNIEVSKVIEEVKILGEGLAK